jgi:hypothetical protein
LVQQDHRTIKGFTDGHLRMAQSLAGALVLHLIDSVVALQCQVF